MSVAEQKGQYEYGYDAFEDYAKRTGLDKQGRSNGAMRTVPVKNSMKR